MRQYSAASRIIHGSWLMAVLVLSYAYTGVLISLISNPRYQLSVQSIEDVAANENIVPLIINESSTHTEFEVKEENHLPE